MINNKYLSNKKEQMSENNFVCCYYLNNSYIDMCNACETPHSTLGSNTPRLSDKQENDLACRECQCICWPLCIVADIITCPYRFGKHIHNKYKQNVITEQPKSMNNK